MLVSSYSLEVTQLYLDSAVFLFQAFLGHAHEVQVVDLFQHGFVTVRRHHIKGGLVVAEHGDSTSARFP